MTTYSEEQCLRQGCEELWVSVVSSGSHYFTRLCKSHEQELEERAAILGGYSMVNAEDGGFTKTGIPHNVWGWRLDDKATYLKG